LHRYDVHDVRQTICHTYEQVGKVLYAK
jgi:hypothetical protein